MFGVECLSDFEAAVTGNRIVGFDTAIFQCQSQDNIAIH